MIPERSQKARRDMIGPGTPRLVNGKASVSPPGDLRYDRRSRYPLSYVLSENRKK